MLSMTVPASQLAECKAGWRTKWILRGCAGCPYRTPKSVSPCAAAMLPEMVQARLQYHRAALSNLIKAQRAARRVARQRVQEDLASLKAVLGGEEKS